MIDDDGVGARVGKHIARYQSLEHGLEQALAGLVVLLVILHAVFLSHSDERLEVGIGEREALVKVVDVFIAALDASAMLVDIVDGKLVDDVYSRLGWCGHVLHVEVDVQGLLRTKVLHTAISIELQFIINGIDMDVSEHH